MKKDTNNPYLNVFIIYSIFMLIINSIIYLNFYVYILDIPDLIIDISIITHTVWSILFIYTIWAGAFGKKSSILTEVGGISFFMLIFNLMVKVITGIFFNDIDIFSLFILIGAILLIFAGYTQEFNYNLFEYINYRKAYRYHGKEEYDKAIKIYNNLIDKNYNYSYIYYNAALIYQYQNKDFKKAIELYDKSISLDPDFIDSYISKSEALYELNRYEEALNTIEEILIVNPDNPEFLVKKGLLLNLLERHEDALKSIDKSLEIDDTNHYSWFIKGFLLYRLKKYEDALESYDKSLELDPNCTDSFNYKALVFEELKEYDKALECYDKSLKLDLNNGDTLNSKGFLLTELNKPEEGLKYINKSLEIEPNNSYILHSKAYTLEKLGRFDEALKYYDKSLKIDPEDEDSIEDRKKLLKKMNNE